MIAAFIVMLMMLTMLGLRSVTRYLKHKSMVFNVKIELDDIENVKMVLKKLMDEEINIRTIKLDEHNGITNMLLEVGFSKKISSQELMYDLCSYGSVKEFMEI